MYCRGGNLPPATLQVQPVWLNGTAPRHAIPTERMERRNPLKLQKYPTQGKECYLSRSLRSFHSVGMTCWGWFHSTAQVVFETWHGDESSPLHLFRILCYTIHRNRLYSIRGGRQVAAPTPTCNVFCILRMRNDDRYVENGEIQNKYIVGVVLRAANQNLLIAGGNHTIIPSAISRPPRWMYNLWG